MTDSAVFEGVRQNIADSLAVAKSEITLQSRLVDDLGVDSLDLVDIVFTLERKFGINVRETEFNFLTRLDFSSPEVMREGFLTAPVVDKLADWLPQVADAPDRSKISPRALFSMITVESICVVVERRLAVQAAVVK
ncbi:MAG TPA: acyl carrier protein [Polyangiaceae bacterium]|nr:acyl carrier protein [Polyangiaceae bacterium]